MDLDDAKSDLQGSKWCLQDRIRANQWKTSAETDLRFLECLHHERQFLHRAGDSSHGDSHHRRNDWPVTHRTTPNSCQYSSVMLYTEMYLDTPEHILDGFFEDVKDETLDFTKVTGQTHPAPAERPFFFAGGKRSYSSKTLYHLERPGFHRLADKDPEARNNSWTRFFSGICNAICGLREQSKVDPSTAREDYYISDTSHGMMIKTMPDGDLEPILLWFGAEEIAYQRVTSLAEQHRKPKWVPDDEERVSNSIVAMTGDDILTFYNRNLSMLPSVHSNHEFLKDGTPDVTWIIQKLLILEAKTLTRRDPNRAIRLNALANRNKPSAAPTAPVADTPPNESTTLKKKGFRRTFKSTGKCRFGDDCRFGHAASEDAPAAAACLPAAVAIQDPEEDQMVIDLFFLAGNSGLILVKLDTL